MQSYCPCLCIINIHLIYFTYTHYRFKKILFNGSIFVDIKPEENILNIFNSCLGRIQPRFTLTKTCIYISRLALFQKMMFTRRLINKLRIKIWSLRPIPIFFTDSFKVSIPFFRSLRTQNDFLGLNWSQGVSKRLLRTVLPCVYHLPYWRM